MSYKFGSGVSGSNKFAFIVNVVTGSPADGVTYYFGTGQNGFTLTVNSNATRWYVPANGTLNKIYAKFQAVTTGSAENCTLNVVKNSSVITPVSTTIKLNTSPVTLSTTTFGMSLVAGDYIQFQFVSPTWATNPLNCTASIIGLVE